MGFEADTIASLAVAHPDAIPTLERLGIDYCCSGATTVAEACRRAGVDPAELRALVETEKDAGGHDWRGASLTSIIAFVLETHHAYTRRALAALPPLAGKVRARHGDGHPEVRHVEALLERLVADLVPHLQKEERVLFPYVLELEAGRVSEGCFGSVRNPIRVMTAEHETAGEILSELRRATSGYVLPADACTSFRALYVGLRELETDLHRHIHLENNILFPGALALEGAAALA